VRRKERRAVPESPELLSADYEAQLRDDLSRVVITLLKGVVYRDADEAIWHKLTDRQSQVRDHVAVLGLRLMVDEAEGYAWLASLPADEQDAGALPRLVARRPVGFLVSLLLALLRKRLLEADAGEGALRLVLPRRDIIEMARVFLPRRANEVITENQFDQALNQIASMDFLKKLPGEGPTFEVRRIIKAFVDAEWLSDFDDKLASYLTQRGLTVERGGAGSGH
jgi:hypothetical protein